MDSIIRHSGFVIEEDEKQFYVRIEAQSACSACHAKGMCNSSDKTDKIIEVQKKNSIRHNIGDFVTIEMNQSVGTKAVIIAYIIPFLILIFTFILTNYYISNQGFVGLLSLFSIVPYYLVLWLYRQKHKTNFEFRII